MIMCKDYVIIYSAVCIMAGEELLGWVLEIGRVSTVS